MADSADDAVHGDGVRKRLRSTRYRAAAQAGSSASDGIADDTAPSSVATSSSVAVDSSVTGDETAERESFAQEKRKYRKGPQTLSEVEEHIATVVSLRSFKDLVKGEKLDILMVYFNIIARHMEEQSRNKGRKAKPVEAVEQTAKTLRRSPTSVKRLVQSWKDAFQLPAEQRLPALFRILHVENSRETSQEKRARISQHCYPIVRDYVRTMRLNRSRVTARQIVDVLVAHEKLNVERNVATNEYDRKALSSALRTVQRFLIKHKFKRGRKTGTLKVGDDQVVLRNKYIKTLLNNREAPQTHRKREVYLDESYIHQHYNRLENSLYDPNDVLDTATAPPAKGRRYCFLAAIQGPSISTSAPAGLVPGSVWAFCPQAASASRGDYHKNFNGKNFVKWWKDQLLPNLHEPSLIIMDNAAYHKTIPESAPNPTRMRKADILSKLVELKLPFETPIQVLEARGILQHWVNQNVEFEVVQLARDLGHEVLFTPPRYSDLQPIELVWAHIKGAVGRQYTAGTKLADVKARLDVEFAKLEQPQGCDLVGRIISSVDRVIDRFMKEMQEEDELVDQELAHDVEDGDIDEVPLEGNSDSDESDDEGETSI